MTQLRLLSYDPSPKRTRHKPKQPESIIHHPMIAKSISDRIMEQLFQRFNSPKSEYDYRNRALFAIMSSTGLRAAEIVSLSFGSRLTTPDGRIGFRYTKKGGKPMVTIPSASAIEAVREYHEKFGIKSDYFFLSMKTNAKPVPSRITSRTLQRIIDSWEICRADGQKASPHSFRHTVGQKVFIRAGSIAAQKILGHSSPLITSKFYTLPYYDGSALLDWSSGEVKAPQVNC